MGWASIAAANVGSFGGRPGRDDEIRRLIKGTDRRKQRDLVRAPVGRTLADKAENSYRNRRYPAIDPSMCGELVGQGGDVITELDFDIPDGLFDATLIALVLPKQIFLALDVLRDALCGVG